MKKTLLLFISMLTLVGIVKSQDLIVKNNNDSINCKVIKQNDETVFYFTYINKEEITNAIKRTDIKTLILNYYTEGAKSTSVKTGGNGVNTSTLNRKPKKQIEIIKGYRFGINYGAAYWIFINPKGLNTFSTNYFNELKTGNAFSGSFNYYGSSNFGIGVQYMKFMSSNSESNVVVATQNGGTQIGNLKDEITMDYFGISCGFRFPLNNNKWRFIADIGIGYSGYNNNAEYITKMNIKASNVGLNTQLGFDHMISKNLALGVTGTLIRSSTASYLVNDGSSTKTVTLPDDERESHNRMDLSIGLRFLIE